MNSKIPLWFVIIVMTVSVTATIFIVKAIYKKDNVTEVNISDDEIKKIIQDARLGYVTEDSLKSLLGKHAELKYITVPRDSIIPRDSLNIIDSIVYVPVFVATEKQFATWEYDNDNYSALIMISTLPSFFPSERKFLSEMKLEKFSVKLKQQPSPKFYSPSKFAIFGGGKIRVDNDVVRFMPYIGGEYKLVNYEIFEVGIANSLEYINKRFSYEIKSEARIKF